MKVIIYAAVDVFYYSFYIEGFYKVFGRNKLEFQSSAFPSFPERTFAAIVRNKNEEIKIAIDAFDSTRINEELAKWSDIYGKVNYQSNKIPPGCLGKVKPIGPSFGIRIWNLPQLLYYSVLNYRKAKGLVYMKENFFKNYWRQYRRLPLKNYQPCYQSDHNYIYFISSLWKKEDRVNKKRAEFILACKNIKEIDFEGGFAPRSDGDTLGYDKLITNRLGLKDYIRKIKKSVLVFNTPAVQDCHGWKLAEYLALGKTIISTRMFNEFPANLVNRKHLYILEKNEYLESVIKEINQNPDFRSSLEKNARLYYENNLKPEIVINRLLKHSEAG
jgi:glycosyltransferase involved in cell wall biosynthesis